MAQFFLTHSVFTYSKTLDDNSRCLLEMNICFLYLSAFKEVTESRESGEFCLIIRSFLLLLLRCERLAILNEVSSGMIPVA